MNIGDFIELIELLASYSQDVTNVILENAQYISLDIKKLILYIFARKIQVTIWENIENSKFYLVVNKVKGEHKKEQMVVVVRFVDKNGHIQ